MTQTLAFYFGTIIFFLGVILAAMGFANVLAQRFEFLILAALGAGIVLIIVGLLVSRGKPDRETP